jgi:hypothetical protein
LFEHAASDRWPKHLRCRFEKLRFKTGIHDEIEFAVTEEQKQETTAVSFWDCPAVDFIDIEILRRFPNLNGLKFFRSEIPVLKNIFTVDLKMIQYLGLEQNKIKKLEPHVSMS